jgi:phospholipid/cholesterol/gamma-HCH transport system substrate-binding protein
VSTRKLSQELTALVRRSRDDLSPALAHLENVLAVLNKNEDNIDQGLRLFEPFVRLFTNVTGNGPWLDGYVANLPPVPGP